MTLDISHRHSCKIHAKRRLQERFNMKLTRTEKLFVNCLIRKRHAKFIRLKPPNRVILGIRLRHREIWVVYDKELKTIVTVLEPELKT